MTIIKMAAMFFIGVGSLTIPLSALLPPLYQTSKELRTVLKASNLEKLLSSGEEILEIRKDHEGYVITTSNYHLHAKIVYKGKHVGSYQFEVEYDQPEKRNEES